MIQKSTAHLLALATLTPLVGVNDRSIKDSANIFIEVLDKRFAMYEIRRRNLTFGEKYFQHAGVVMGSSENRLYVDEAAQAGHVLQFTVTGIDKAGNESSAFLTDIIRVGG